MTRYQPLLLGLVAAVVVSSLTIGTPIYVPLLVSVLGLGLAWSRWGGGRALADGRWASSSIGALSTAQPPPSTRIASEPRDIVRSLGVVEGRHLARSGWFGAGVGFCLMMFVLFVFVWGSDNTDPWQTWIQYSSWFVHPFVGFVVIASHRAVTRPSRDHTDELFDTCPAGSSTRTAGMLASAWMPVVATVVFLGVMSAGVASRSPDVHGPLDLDSIADLLAALALPAGGVALGVALGRWIPFSLTPIIAVVAVGFATVALNAVGGPNWNPYIELSTAPTIEGPSPLFSDRPAWWHLAWIVGLVALVGVIGIARDRRDRRVFAAGAVSVALVVVAGIGATRPLSSASGDRIADLVARPEAHQECRDIDGRVEVCMFPFHRQLLDEVVRRVTPVVAALPAATGSITVRQVHGDDIEQLPPEVRERLKSVDLERPADEVALPSLGDLLTSTHAIALHATGLPTAADAQLLPYVAAGQARGVVALWLATRGLDGDDLRAATTSEDPSSSDPFDRGAVGGVGDCSVPSVVWSAQDLVATRALVRLPHTEVAAVITSGWDRWTDPATGTDELMTALGLPTVGPFDRVVARAGNPC